MDITHSLPIFLFNQQNFQFSKSINIAPLQDTPREARTPDKGGATKAIKILTNPAKAEKEVGKQSNKRPPSRLVVASKGDAREGDFKGEVKSDTKQAADAKSTKDSKATGDSAKPVKQEAEENKQKKSRVRYKVTHVIFIF